MKQLTTLTLIFVTSLASLGAVSVAWAQAEPSTSAEPPAEDGAAAPATTACFPQCRAGYVCASGQCVPACNPPCPAGTQCTPDLTCEPVESAEEAPAEAEPPPPMTRRERRLAREIDREREREARRQEREEQRAEIDKQRLANRRNFRIQMGMGLGIGEGYYDDAAVFHFGFQPGIRWNFHDHFGFSVLGNFYMGTWDDTIFDNGSLLGMRAHFNPYFGPLGRFIIGPSVVLGRTWYTAEEEVTTVGPGGLENDTAEFTQALWVTGIGFRGGLLLGATESVEIAFGIYRLTEDTSPRFSLFQETEVDFSAGFAF